MSYFEQFKRFSPLEDIVSAYPISQLPNIASRARFLLQSRTLEQLQLIARNIDFAIDSFFDEIRENEIARLRRILMYESDERASQFFEWDGGTIENGRWLFKEAMEDELDILSRENTSDIEALKELSDYWDEIGQELIGFESCELFATLALWKVADTIHGLGKQSDYIEEGLSKVLDNLHQAALDMGIASFDFKITTAAKDALYAMEAICFAEHLKALSKLHEDFIRKEKIRTDDISKQNSLRAKELNIARHKKRNQAMQKVINEWSASPANWPSAEKAGLYFSDWLSKKGYEYEPRTVAGWIRKYAKEAGIKLR